MNLNFGFDANRTIGIDYTIDDQTLNVASTSTSTTPILDAFFIIHASQGIPRKAFKNLTEANAKVLFGELTDKHGMQALACKQHLSLGLTATIMRIDEGGTIANSYPIINFTSALKEVYVYGGEAYNVTETQVKDGTFDVVLETLDITSTYFLANAKKVKLPVLNGIVSSSSLVGAEDEDSILTNAAALYAEAAGSNGIKNRTIVPGVFYCPGAGKYGNKIKVSFTDALTIRNTVQTKLMMVYNGITETTTTYSAISLVQDKLDENNIALFVGDKLRDKKVINDYNGDLNLRYAIDDTNREGLIEAFAEYYQALSDYIVNAIAVNSAKITAADPNDPGDSALEGVLTALKTTVDSMYELVYDGTRHPFQILGLDGNSIYGSVSGETYGAKGFNMISLDSDLLGTSFALTNGDDGIVKNMRTFSYEKENTAKTKTIADLYVEALEGTIDSNVLDIEEVESVLTYDVDYPAKVRTALLNFIKHGVNTRGDIVAIGGGATSIADYDSALEYAKAVKNTTGKYHLTIPNAEIYDSTLYKTYRVNGAFLLIDALAAWYNGDRKSPVSDYGMNPNIREGSLRPKVIKSDLQSELKSYDANLIKKVDGVYRLRSQLVQLYGSNSKLKELGNLINFCYLIKEVHLSLNRNTSSSGTTGLTAIKEKISKDISDFSKYFDAAPTVTVAYADDDAEARGEASLGITTYMSGTVNKWNITFTVKNSSSSS